MAYDHKEYCRQYYQRNREKLKEKVREYARKNPEKVRLGVLRKNKQTYWSLRLAALHEYGGKCACCGETGIEFLTIDHVFNDGNEHRKITTKVSYGMMGWLKRNNYPQNGEFQILCWNCNMGKKHNNGVCPHQTLEGSTTIAQASTAERLEARGIRKD